MPSCSSELGIHLIKSALSETVLQADTLPDGVQMEDEHEKQARMQRAALLEQFGPESVAFQFAKSRVDKMVRVPSHFIPIAIPIAY